MYINNHTNLANQTLFETNKNSVNLSGGATFEDYMEAMQSTISKKDSVADEASTKPTIPMDTTKGSLELNLDDYFAPKSPSNKPMNLFDVPLLLPSAHNVDTLAKYSEQKVKDLMQQYNIPKPPATIEFDQQGQLVLPQDYPYAAQLKHAFNENPQVEKALSTTAALASHYAGIMEGQPFRDEMSTARTQADRDRIVEKHGYLFDDNKPSIQIVLSFLDDGSMLIGGRGGATDSETMLKVYS
jgi:vancomycin resistance protein YoaR